MKYAITLLFGLLVLPFTTFAATLTPAQISAIEQELSQLEAQLRVLLAGQQSAPVITATTTSTTVATPALSIGNLQPNPTSISNSGEMFNVQFTVTTGNTTIDVPQNSTGVVYQISGDAGGSVPATIAMQCPNVATYDETSYCEVPPNTTSTFDITATLSTVLPDTPVMTVSQVKYYTGIGTSGANFGYYQTTGLKSADYVSE